MIVGNLNRGSLVMQNAGATALASFVRGLGPAAWFRFNTGITVTGAGVSQWDDQSGNARHLLQATDTNRPALEADGSITFDGADNYLKCDAFTLDQPETRYLLFKQVSWTDTDVVCAGNGTTNTILQASASPQVRLVNVGNVSLTLDTYGVIAAVLNSTSSLIQLNNGTPVTGNVGANNSGGFTLGANGTPAVFANIQVKEVILYAAAHDAATRARVIRYLAQVGGLNV